MGRPGLRKKNQYSEDFKATAVKLSQLAAGHASAVRGRLFVGVIGPSASPNRDASPPGTGGGLPPRPRTFAVS